VAKTFTRAEIREQLYVILRELREFKNSHLRAFGVKHDVADLMYGSLRECNRCHVCIHCDGQISGVIFAIRRFGGRPRY
jgi:hypothetical protein